MHRFFVGYKLYKYVYIYILRFRMIFVVETCSDSASDCF